jgi:hypothetical protein
LAIAAYIPAEVDVLSDKVTKPLRLCIGLQSLPPQTLGRQGAHTVGGNPASPEGFDKGKLQNGVLEPLRVRAEDA